MFRTYINSGSRCDTMVASLEALIQWQELQICKDSANLACAVSESCNSNKDIDTHVLWTACTHNLLPRRPMQTGLTERPRFCKLLAKRPDYLRRLLK